MRVVSLLPSATEIVCALGARESLVGVSHECDYPEGIARVPHCVAPKRPLGQGSAAIDRSVKAILAESLSVYRVDTETLKALAPDLVVTQAQCEICAVSERELEAALAEWTGAQPRLVSLSPMTLADVRDDIRRVGVALGKSEAGERLAAAKEARMAAIGAQAGRLPRRRVAFLDWIEPLIMGAEWIPELIAMAGGEPVLAEAGTHATAIAPQALMEADPEVLIVAPCGFSIAETLPDMGALASLPGFGDLSAVRLGEVYLADGNHYFNRPGPRLADSLEIVAEILQPAHFSFGHAGTAFRRWP